MQNFKKTVRRLIIRHKIWLILGTFFTLAVVVGFATQLLPTTPIPPAALGRVALVILGVFSVLMVSPFVVAGVIDSLAKDWPEIYIMQAQQLLKTNPELASVLILLMEECERTGNGGDLKEWLNGYGELASVRQELGAISQDLNKEKERRERLVELQVKAQELATKLRLLI